MYINQLLIVSFSNTGDQAFICTECDSYLIHHWVSAPGAPFIDLD